MQYYCISYLIAAGYSSPKKYMRYGYFADAIKASCEVVNLCVRDIMLFGVVKEFDSAGLMKWLFLR